MQDLERLQTWVMDGVAGGTEGEVLGLRIQLAIAERLDGILTEMKKEKPIFNSFLEGMNKKDDDRPMPDLSKTPTA